MKKKLIIGALVASAGAVGWYAWHGGAAPQKTLDPRAAAPLGVDPVAALPAYEPGSSVCRFTQGWRASYDYRGQVDSTLTLAGQPVAGTQPFSGKLAFEALQETPEHEWVLVGQFSQMNKELLDAHGAGFEAPFLLKVGARCEVRAFGRLTSVAQRAAQAQQVAVHDFWVYSPSADGTEPMTFSNGAGVARARFTRRGNELERTLTGYELSWRSKAAFQVTSSSARATLGDGWLQRFESHEGMSGGVVTSALLSLTLEREATPTAAVAASASRAVADYTWENLLSGDFTAARSGLAALPAAEQRYVEQMKNETLERAFEALVLKVDERTNVEDQWHELAGFLNGHPEQIPDFAAGLMQDDFPEQAKAVSYLALGKTVHPEARDVLMGLRSEPTLRKIDRVRASVALLARKDVGAELAYALKEDALSGESTRPGVDDGNALLHLGALAGLHRGDAEVQSIARGAITQALGGAGNDLAQLTSVFGALGNLADPGLLSTIEGYSQGELEVRVRLPRALRGYPYAQSEPLMLAWLARETSPEVKQEIFNVVHHQLADAQRTASQPMVAEALEHLALQPTVFARQSIIHIVGPAKREVPAVKSVLMTQLAVEFRNKSGLYGQIANYLSPEELNLALAQMPEFEHQYGAAAKQQAVQAALEAEQKETAPGGPVSNRPLVPDQGGVQ
ncbi:MAG: hypothetical protein Q8L48_31800 [Archangium sp.]|nr:hypothetical protein [Archangium sp.]